MTISTRIMLVLAVACFSQQPAVAAEIEGVQFAERLSAGDAELELRGTGLLRYRVFFKGYVAAFYMAEASGEATASDVLGNVPRRHRPVPGPQPRLSARPKARKTSCRS